MIVVVCRCSRDGGGGVRLYSRWRRQFSVCSCMRDGTGSGGGNGGDGGNIASYAGAVFMAGVGKGICLCT
jgi:hypothetical protein